MTNPSNLSNSSPAEAQAEPVAERALFDAWLKTAPKWAPEFEQHRPWVESFAFFAWLDGRALVPIEASRASIVEKLKRLGSGDTSDLDPELLCLARAVVGAHALSTPAQPAQAQGEALTDAQLRDIWVREKGGVSFFNAMRAVRAALAAATPPAPPAVEPSGAWTVIAPNGQRFTAGSAHRAANEANRAMHALRTPEERAAADANLAALQVKHDADMQAEHEHLNCPACGGSGHIDDVAAAPQPQAAQDVLSDAEHFSAQLTRSKRLLVDIWQRHPDARALIEARTGSWFVWGSDRAAIDAELRAGAGAGGKSAEQDSK